VSGALGTFSLRFFEIGFEAPIHPILVACSVLHKWPWPRARRQAPLLSGQSGQLADEAAQLECFAGRNFSCTRTRCSSLSSPAPCRSSPPAARLQAMETRSCDARFTNVTARLPLARRRPTPAGLAIGILQLPRHAPRHAAMVLPPSSRACLTRNDRGCQALGLKYAADLARTSPIGRLSVT